MLRAGIVGLPNVGKSTLFNALTRTRKAAAENYPFCTIEPNVGVLTVPDQRLAPLARVAGVETIVPATVELVDIAGLVKGAAQGEGLGNKFLAHIREVDAIVEVVRCFRDPDVVHVEADLHPVSDIDTVATELLLADLESATRRKERLEKSAKGGDKALREQVELAARLVAHLDSGRPARTFERSAEEAELLRGFFLLTDKPTLYACNVAEEDLAGAEEIPLVGEVGRWAKDHRGAEATVVSAKIEAELAELPESEAAEYLATLGVRESGAAALVRKIYELLGLITFFTMNEKEVRAWTIPSGETASRAAGKIHTDFERGFIRAETIGWRELVETGGWHAAKEQGRIRSEGHDHMVRDGDVILFRFHV